MSLASWCASALFSQRCSPNSVAHSVRRLTHLASLSCVQIQQWNVHIDEMDERESELFDILVDNGYDMRAFYEDTLVKPVISMAMNDPVEQLLEQTVSRLLDKIRPVERLHGSCSERRPIGAST
eukprot:3630547-Prymnesium_polylepis.1